MTETLNQITNYIENVKETMEEIILYVKEEKNFIINEDDVLILLKESGCKDILHLKKDIIDDDNIVFFSNMTKLLVWQNDGEFDAIEPLEKVLNYSIDENFIEKYNELGCKSLADYYNAKNKEEVGTRVMLSNSVAYIYG